MPKIFKEIKFSKKEWKENCTVVRHGKWICWEWKFGYSGGRPSVASERAARFVYRLFYGKLKYDALHRCDNIRCVRPTHIEDGTHSKNMRDLWRRSSTVPKLRKSRSENMKRLNQRSDFKIAQRKRASVRMTELWRDKVWRKKMNAIMHSTEAYKKVAAGVKLWHGRRTAQEKIAWRSKLSLARKKHLNEIQNLRTQ